MVLFVIFFTKCINKWWFHVQFSSCLSLSLFSTISLSNGWLGDKWQNFLDCWLCMLIIDCLAVISHETFTMCGIFCKVCIFIRVRFSSVRFRFDLIIITITAAKRYSFCPQRSRQCRTQLCAPSFCRNSSINCSWIFGRGFASAEPSVPIAHSFYPSFIFMSPKSSLSISLLV